MVHNPDTIAHTPRKRIVGYDAAKAISMFLVVLIHLTYYTSAFPNTFFSSTISSLAVYCCPVFFMVNGALLLPRTFSFSKHFKRTGMLIGIVFLWRCFSFIPYFLLSSPHLNAHEVVYYLLMGNIDSLPTGYFWFINALIGIYLIYPWVKLIFDQKDKRYLYTMMGVLAVFSILLPSIQNILHIVDHFFGRNFASLFNSIEELNVWGQRGNAVLYFLLGGLLGKNVVAHNSPANNPDDIHTLPTHSQSQRFFSRFAHSPVFLLLSFIVMHAIVSLILLSERQWDPTRLFADDGYRLLPSFMGSIILFLLCFSGKIPRWLAVFSEFIGKNTFGIYMLHVFFLLAIHNLQAHGFLLLEPSLPTWLSVLFNLLLVLAVVVLTAAVSELAKKIPYVRKMFTL
ncbi:acyltransferase [Alloscardovia venturai]|uniref:Acyltransferase n=1 Tax=Alloscardovia venturai TaxID=1769421 RepID=A0ABW2Y6N7_9BIFI